MMDNEENKSESLSGTELAHKIISDRMTAHMGKNIAKTKVDVISKYYSSVNTPEKAQEEYATIVYRHRRSIENIMRRYTSELDEAREVMNRNINVTSGQMSKKIEKLISATVELGLIDKKGRYPWEEDYDAR